MQAASNTIRRHDLDWLRIIGVLAVFVYHSLHFFDLSDWSVKNAVTYDWVGSMMDVLAVWMMPLVFLVSGQALFFSSRKGGALAFLRDKVMRLLVPLFVGTLTFSIGQVYVERVSHRQFSGSFFAFIPHYFEGVYLPGEPGNFAFHGMHLWYLLALFVFIVALMPLLWWFRSRSGEAVLRTLTRVLALPGAILLLCVPTILLQSATDSGALGGDFSLGGWPLVHYVWFLLAGYLIAADERVRERIAQARWIAVFAAIGALAWSFSEYGGFYRHTDLATWAMLFAFMGFATRRLSFSNQFLEYANGASMTFYVLHQNVLLFWGFFAVGWAMPDTARYFTIALPAFAICVLLYEYAIRRSNVPRMLFGMKPLPRDKTRLAGTPATRRAGVRPSHPAVVTPEGASD